MTWVVGWSVGRGVHAGWLAWLAAVFAAGCGSGGSPSGTGNDGGGGTGASNHADAGSTCSLTFSGAETGIVPCTVNVANEELLSGVPSTSFGLNSTTQGNPNLLFVATLSNAADFHVGRYDAANVVSASANSLLAGTLGAAWRQSFKFEDFSDQGSFALMIASIGTVETVAPVTGPAIVAGWRNSHGTLDITLTPVMGPGAITPTTGEVMVHATF